MRLRMMSAAVLVFVAMIGVRSASAVCSNTTLQGVYGYSHGRQGGTSGIDLIVSQFTADGQGLLKGSWTLSVSGGSISTGTFLGRYVIAQNCTGTLTFNHEDNGNSSAHYNIVLDDGNQGFQMIQTDSGSAQPGFGVAQGTVTCGLTGKKQTFATNFLGVNSSSQIEAIVGQVTLDGKGHISGSETFSINFINTKLSLTGTYTQKADCLGTAQITPKGSAAMNFNTVEVNGGKELLLIETDTGTFLSGTAQE
jgi:hypothetical protein